MAEDQEIVAMTAIARALEALDEGARARTLGWAASKFGVQLAGTHSGNSSRLANQPRLGEDPQAFADLAELFAAAQPKTEKEKALVACYWIQVGQGQANFPSQAVNAGLKDLGHGIGNITHALDALKAEKPALVLQLQKSGTAKQSRKTYRVTQEGIKRVLQMVKGDANE